MKYTTLATLSFASLALLSSCGQKDDHGSHDGHDHGKKEAHVHGPDCNHEDEKAHKHGPDCDHGDEGHKHSADCDHEDEGHKHGPDCDHGEEAKHEHGAGCDHAHVKAGPHKGRMIESVSPAAEFVVLDDRKVQIHFYDANMQAVAPSTQQVVVVTGDRATPVELSFVAQGSTLISEQALPAGENFPTTVAIKADANAKHVLEKFTLNLSDCSKCDNKEYSCECHH